MRRTVAAALVGATLTLAPAAYAVPPIGVGQENGCYYVWISAKQIPLFCLAH